MVPETTNIPALDPIGHITVVYGTATARSADGTRALSQGDPVYRGENIVTGPESSVEITFQDDTILSQSQNSRVDLDTYVFDPDTGAGDALLKLTQGAFRMATGAIVETNPDKFRVQSPLATIGIRGTDTGHVVPGAGSNQPENHSCLDYEGHPVVVQSNMGGPPQTLFGAGLGVPASPMGLGSIGALSGAQMAFFGTMTPGSMSQGPPSFSPPPEFSTPPLPAGDDGGDDAPGGDQPGDQGGDQGGDQAGDQAGGQEGTGDAGPDAGGDPTEGLEPGTGLGLNAPGGVSPVAPPVPGPDAGDGQPGQGDQAGQSGQETPPPEFAPPDEGGGGDEGGGDDGGDSDILDQEQQDQQITLTTTPSSGSDVTSGTSGGETASGGETSSGGGGETAGPSGGSLMHGGTWSGDTADYSNYAGCCYGVYVNLAHSPPFASYSDYSDMENLNSAILNVIGSNYDDYVGGTSQANTLSGGGGSDSLVGSCGNDVVSGGSGDDHLFGDDQGTAYSTAGHDIVCGGDGNDQIEGGDYADSLYGDSGTDTIYGEYNDASSLNPGNDYIEGGADGDSIYGNEGNDIIYGDGTAEASTDGGDSISGGAGDDQIYGGSGDDSIGGDEGADSIFGGSGNDAIVGGDGGDVLWGGDTASPSAGTDVFGYTGVSESNINGDRSYADSIKDFTTSEDRIELSSSIFTSSYDEFGFNTSYTISAPLPVSGTETGVFYDAGTGKVYAMNYFYNSGTGQTEIYVNADADQNWNPASDMCIMLEGDLTGSLVAGTDIVVV